MKLQLLLMSALLLLVPGAALAAPLPDPLPHDCSGVVDVSCTDTCEPCQFPDQCQGVPYRHCLVWVLYLDISLPADDGPVFCQDSPYYHG